MVTSVWSAEIGRKWRICEENWSMMYTFGYRHRLREMLIMKFAISSPYLSTSSSRRSHSGRSCGLVHSCHSSRWPCS